MAKFNIGDKVMDSAHNEDTGEVVDVLENNNINYYKVKFFQNGDWRVSGFLPEFRLEHIQLNLFV